MIDTLPEGNDTNSRTASAPTGERRKCHINDERSITNTDEYLRLRALSLSLEFPSGPHQIPKSTATTDRLRVKNPLGVLTAGRAEGQLSPRRRNSLAVGNGCSREALDSR